MRGLKHKSPPPGATACEGTRPDTDSPVVLPDAAVWN